MSEEIEDVAPKEVDLVEEETDETEHSADDRIAELEERIRELEAKLDGLTTTTTVIAEPEPERAPNPTHPWFRKLGK